MSFRFANAAGAFYLLVLTDEGEVLAIGLELKQSEGRLVGRECFLYREGGQIR